MFRSSLGLFSYIVPKRKDLLVFFPVHDKHKFSGNLSSLFLYVHHYEKQFKSYYLTDNKEVSNDVKIQGFNAVYLGPKMVWLLLRCKYIITDGTFPAIASGKFSIVQLWHGTGFKKVGSINENLNKRDRKLFLCHYSKYALIVANSESDRLRKNAAFNSSRAVITGSPKNDYFFSEVGRASDIKLKYNLHTYDKVISYLPTFRDFETTSPFTAVFWTRLNQHLLETNQIFVIKKHPWERYLKVPEGFSHILDLSSEIENIQELLMISDLIVSDYSSVVTDYVLLDKPMLFYFYDYKQYKETCRDMYYNIEEVLPGPFVYNERDLLSKLINTAWFAEPEIKRKYEEFKNMFHAFRDGDSCKRVFNHIRQL